jgi:hypothetical protein
MSSEARQPEHYFKQPRGMVLLWAGLLLPPAAWAIQFGVIYVMVPFMCMRGSTSVPIFMVALIGAAVAAVGTALAYYCWKLAGFGWRATGESAVDRARFMALNGFFFGLYLVAVILMQALVNFGTDVCAGSMHL